MDRLPAAKDSAGVAPGRLVRRDQDGSGDRVSHRGVRAAGGGDGELEAGGGVMSPMIIRIIMYSFPLHTYYYVL